MELLSPTLNIFTPTNILIGITVAISFYAFNNRKVMQDLILNPYVINTRNQYYRFLSSGFLHNDHMHLIMNMLSLYFFGSAVDMVFGAIFGSMGTVYYLALYLSGIIVSDLPTYYKHKDNPRYNALGASGGVAAVIFSFIVFLPLEKICLYFAICIPGFILGTLYVVYSWYQGRRSNDNINHDAHLYGAAFGLAFSVVAYPPAISNFFAQIAGWDWKLF